MPHPFKGETYPKITTTLTPLVRLLNPFKMAKLISDIVSGKKGVVTPFKNAAQKMTKSTVSECVIQKKRRNRLVGEYYLHGANENLE